MAENDNSPPDEVIILTDHLATIVREQYELDRAEAGPKLPVDSIYYQGIGLESRFSVVSEFETMKRVVDAMPELLRMRVESIWCDSRACADYVVELRSGRWLERCGMDIRDVFLAVTRGYNGLAVRGDGQQEFFNPEWLEDDDQ